LAGLEGDDKVQPTDFRAGDAPPSSVLDHPVLYFYSRRRAGGRRNVEMDPHPPCEGPGGRGREMACDWFPRTPVMTEDLRPHVRTSLLVLVTPLVINQDPAMGPLLGRPDTHQRTTESDWTQDR
jgi:hypothetical protein